LNSKTLPEDCQFTAFPYKNSEIAHRYGDNLHLLSNPYLLSLLGIVCKKETIQPLLSTYMQILYSQMLGAAVNTVFPRKKVSWPTRMQEFTDRGVFVGEVIDNETPAVVVSLARAGIIPSHVCFTELNHFLDARAVRQDHFYMNRKTDANGKVIGVDVAGSKIGGDQENAVVIFPDPMGATGGSLCHAIDHYKKQIKGKARSYVALHLIVTPEYVQRMSKEHPDVVIFALRLDRGLSDSDVLASIPGTYPEREKGLTDNQYIVPGAGGVGEILNNSFV
jgi:uracil phosphoribosyltransferase